MDTFLYWLLAQAWFTQEDNLQQLHEDLELALLDRLNAKILEQIPADKHELAGELISSEDADAWNAFVHTYIPEYDDFLANVCDEFADEYLDSMDEAHDITDAS